MAQTIQIKQSSTAADVPATLLNGELAVNTADKILYVGDGSNVIELARYMDMVYALKFDDVGSNICYIGEAVPGSLSSVAQWRIQKIDTNAGDAVITWAGGNSNFDNVWDDRLTLGYS